MKTIKRTITTAALCFLLLGVGVPSFAHASETAAWIPWFGPEAGAEGAESAIKNIDRLDVIYLFTYEVEPDGTIVNRANYEAAHWQELIEVAKDNDVKVIPTIAWFAGEEIHAVLSDRSDRRAHIKDIIDIVEDGDFDGINIDYEGKKKETRDHFSTFLKDLNKQLGDKSLTCALEARTPPDSLFRNPPAVMNYSVDYKVANRECDWVEIMAYDQQRADIKLNEQRRGVPYMPVADRDWVEKVIKETLKEIDNDKILLGVPTYGRAWDVTVAPEWYRDYTRVAGLNHPRIMELSRIYKSRIGRTAGGEAVISYFPKDYTYAKTIKRAVKRAPSGTPRGFESAAQALKYATDKNKEVSVRFVTWSDATAIRDKVRLADKYNLKGTAIFKVDGEEDPRMWRLFK